MKPIIAVLLFMSFSIYSHSQKLDASKVPQTVKDALSKAHPGVKVSWEKEDADYEANFTEGGKAMSCIIDGKGTIVETESAIAASELPAPAKAYVDKHYKGKKWKEVAKIVKANGEVNYEVNAGGTDVLFDANGKHLEKKADKEKD